MPDESWKFALMPHGKKVYLCVTDHYSIQLAHLSASWVVTVLSSRLMRLGSYDRITGGHYLCFEQVGFVTCFVADGFIQFFGSPGTCWMFAVTWFDRILQWAWIAGSSGWHLLLEAGLASNRGQVAQSVLAWLDQAVWPLRMEIMHSLWASSCTHSHSTTASHPVGIPPVVTCGCCFLSFHPMPQGSISSVTLIGCNLITKRLQLPVLCWKVLIWLLVLQEERSSEYFLWWGVASFNNCRLWRSLTAFVQLWRELLRNKIYKSTVLSDSLIEPMQITNFLYTSDL